MINVLSVPHQVTRLVFDTGQPYEKFRSRYEAAVPPVITPPRITAAERRPCTAYLMGCPAIAEKIYRHDPAAMLCAPLPALIYIDSGKIATRPPTTPIPRRPHTLSEPPVRQGGNVQVPMTVQPPAGRCTWRVVRT
jgi:hypothetical protein